LLLRAAVRLATPKWALAFVGFLDNLLEEQIKWGVSQWNSQS
jgi:hypothetical protein